MAPGNDGAVTLAARLQSEALALKFAACGVATLEPSSHQSELRDWLEKGFAGTMRYLHRQADKRSNPALIVPGATRAVVVLDNYYHPGATQPAGEASGDWKPRPTVSIARYAQGADYHRVTGERLARLADWLKQEGATVARLYVDAGPVPERELAVRAGLGWIGKNTMMIRPTLGSWFFIGCILTDLELPVSAALNYDRCGSCTRCLDACPTEALVAPRVLDATRCISYLTIEQKGPIPEELLPHLSGWAFGCDICNEVCPWNVKFAEATEVPEFMSGMEVGRSEPGHFDEMTEAEFARRFGSTAFERPGLVGMRRNWRAAFKSLDGVESSPDSADCAIPGPEH